MLTTWLACIRHILQREPETQRLTILNVAGRGEPLTFDRCIDDGAGETGARTRKMGDAAGSDLSVEAADFGDPSRGRSLYDRRVHHEHRSTAPVPRPEYDHVIRYTVTDAFADSFKPASTP